MMQKAMFGAGCFWRVEAMFRSIPGVVDVVVGFSGGNLDDPTYDEVCTDTTGHAEVALIHFNPTIVTYESLLEIFWAGHDPTTINQAGRDIGTQYRSAIFFYDDAQKLAAISSRNGLQASGKYRRSIVTEISPATDFWPAEERHQRYLQKQGFAMAGSCSEGK
jgi:peptide-methionine (S)-S-oxide reductase